jgi:hypothetical protein
MQLACKCKHSTQLSMLPELGTCVLQDMFTIWLLIALTLISQLFSLALMPTALSSHKHLVCLAQLVLWQV